MDVTQILMLITILVYLAAMVGIGAVLAKQNQTARHRHECRGL